MPLKLLIALTVVTLFSLIGYSHGNEIPSLLGKRIQLQSKYDHRRVMRHRLWKVFADFKSNHRQFQFDSFVDIVPGLSGIGISFRSVNYPDSFFRHTGRKMFLHKYQNNNVYREDASFIPRKGLFRGVCVSFESVNKPGKYLQVFKKNRLQIGRIVGYWHYFKATTWCPLTIRKVVVNGEWALLYGNDNAAANGEYTIDIVEGIDIGTTSSITRSVENSWKFGIEAGFSGWGASVKTMFERSGTVGVSRTSGSSWSKSSKKRHGYTATLIKGQPFYLWQWQVHALTSDSSFITSKTDIYKQTTSNRSPPPIVTQ